MVLLGSLSSEYDGMVKIVENNKNLTLAETKEMLRREYEASQANESNEVALKTLSF